MISVVTVSYRSYPEPIICEFIRTVEQQVTLVDELIVVYGDGRAFEVQEMFGDLRVRHLSTPHRTIQHRRRDGSYFACNYYGEHGAALKYGIDHASNDLVILSDPDVAFYRHGFDAIYLDLLEQYRLNVIGVSHYINTPFFSQFPTVINCLLRKSTLPKLDWMAGYLKHRFGTQHAFHNAGWKFQHVTAGGDDWPLATGEYLLAGFISERISEYPNFHDCFFNTGCNLFLWDKDKGARSITFRCESNGMDYMLPNLVSTVPEFDSKEFVLKYGNKCLLRHSKGFERSYEDKLQVMRTWLKETRRKAITIL